MKWHREMPRQSRPQPVEIAPGTPIQRLPPGEAQNARLPRYPTQRGERNPRRPMRVTIMCTECGLPNELSITRECLKKRARKMRALRRVVIFPLAKRSEKQMNKTINETLKQAKAGAIQSDAAYAVDSRIEGLGIWRRRN
jgi:hypothetical protein